MEKPINFAKLAIINKRFQESEDIRLDRAQANSLLSRAREFFFLTQFHQYEPSTRQILVGLVADIEAHFKRSESGQ